MNAIAVRNIERGVLIGAASIVALLIGDAALTYENTRQLNEDAAWVSHTHEALDLLSTAMSTLSEAESGMRGFVITGEEEFLDSYQTAQARLEDVFVKLREKTGDNPSQQERLKELSSVGREEQAYLRKMIDLRRRQPGAAEAVIAGLEGKTRMDRIRRLVGAMKDEENRLLGACENNTVHAYRLSVGSALVGTFLGLGLVAACVWVLERQLAIRQRAAAETYEQRELLSTTLTSIGDAVISTDAAGKVRFLNPAAEKLTGWTKEAAIDLPLEEVFHIVNEHSGERVENPVEKVLREGTSVGLANHTILIAKDGTRHPIDDSAAPIRDPNGRISGVIMVFRDIHDRKLAEEQRSRLAAIVRSSSDAIIGKDLQGIINSWNESAERLFGYAASEAIGKPITLIIPPDRYDEEAHIISRLRQGEPIEHFETVRMGKDGRRIALSLTVSPVRDDAGRVVGASKVARDITDRKRSEQALADQNLKLRRLVDANIIGITFADLEKIYEANDAFLSLVGYSRADLEAGRLRWREMTPPESKAADDVAVAQLLERGLCKPFQKEYFRKNGTRVPVLMGIATLDPKVPTFVCYVVDLSEQKRAEEGLRQAARQKDEFLATLAHELRNPLAPLRNALAIMHISTDDPARFQDMREIMERQLDQLVRLVDDLLDISRITVGKIELRKDRVDLADMLQSAVETSRPAIDAAKHQLQLTYPPHSLYVVGDSLRLSQVIANLLNNSAKYTSPGGRIELTAERDGAQAVLRVRDNGIGIPPEVLPHVFDMFMQIDKHAKHSQGGLGIGLMLVRRLVHMHGGGVDAHSDGTGRGSEFTVRLPLAADVVVEEGPQTSREHPLVPLSASRSASRRILVVDDNQDSADSLGMLLRVMGNDIRTCHDGPTALKIAREFLPEIVLLDIGMPAMNGYQVARALRTMPETKNAILVAQTGWGQDEDRRRTTEAGFDLHLVKPVDAAALQRLLAPLAKAASEAESRKLLT